MALTPLILAFVAGTAIWRTVRSSRGARLAYAVVALASIVALAWFFTRGLSADRQTFGSSVRPRTGH